MRLYEKHISKHLVFPFLLITFFIVGISWIIQSIRYVEIILGSGARISDFVKLTLCLIPFLLFIIIPISLFFTVYYVYKKLSHDREIIALYSFGISRLHVIKPFFLFSVFVVAMHCFISAYLLPMSIQKFKQLKIEINQSSIINLIQFNTFISKINGITIYIEKREEDNLLKNIFIHDSKNPEKNITFIASSGKFYNTDFGLQLILNNGSKLELDHTNKKYSNVKFAQYSFDGFNSMEATQSKSEQDPYEFTISALLFSDSFPEEKLTRFRTQGHFRLLWPFTSISIILSMLFFLTKQEQSRMQELKTTVYVFGSALLIMATVLGIYTLNHSNHKYYGAMYLLNLAIPIIIGLLLYDSSTAPTRITRIVRNLTLSS
jgi:lipopolysaccharide export system permease protein